MYVCMYVCTVCVYVHVHVYLILNGHHIFGTGNALIAGAIYSIHVYTDHIMMGT